MPASLSKEHLHLFQLEAPIFLSPRALQTPGVFHSTCKVTAAETAKRPCYGADPPPGKCGENDRPFSILLSHVSLVALQLTIPALAPPNQKLERQPFRSLGLLNPKSEIVNLFPHPSLSRARQRACARLLVVHLRGEKVQEEDSAGGEGGEGTFCRKLGSADRNPSFPRASLTAPLPIWRPGRSASFPAGVVDSAREFCAFKLHAPSSSFQPQDSESLLRQPLHPRAASEPGPAAKS